MNLAELTIETTTFTRQENLVIELSKALQTQGVILALQVIKNVACGYVAADPKMTVGMLQAVKLLQALAVPNLKKDVEFDPTTHAELEGFGIVDIRNFPEELRKMPTPPQ
jgi:hypothetical protein